MPPRDDKGNPLPCPKQDEWSLHVLKTVRCDLAWALLHYVPKQSHWRLKSGIKMIIDLLGDEKEWEELKQRWEKEDPGTIAMLYDPPPDLNPAPLKNEHVMDVIENSIGQDAFASPM